LFNAGTPVVKLVFLSATVLRRYGHSASASVTPPVVTFNTPRFINLLSHGNEGIMGQYIVPDIDIGRPLFWSKRPIGSAEFGIWLIK